MMKKTAKTQGSPWETVSYDENEMTDRLKVPGGWLYRSAVFDHRDGSSNSVAMCFVPNGSKITHGVGTKRV